MALLFVDGFDAGDYGVKYTITDGTNLSSSATTRFSSGRSLLKAPNGAGIVRKYIPASASLIIGFAAHYNTNFSGFPAVFAAVFGDNGATGHIHVATGDVSGTVEVSRGYYTTRTVLFTANVPINIWNYYELRVKVADSGGYADLRVNGVTVGTFSGDTKNGGTSTNIDTIVLFGSGNNTGISVYWDDMYVLDETGSAPHNTYLGDVRVHTTVPSAAGTATQFTPSSGANYTTVDELPYSATDYVSAVPSGTKDTYQMTDLPLTPNNIFGVQSNLIAKKSDAGTVSLRPVIRSGGTDYSGTSNALLSSDQTFSHVRTQDPNTSATWTASGVNNLEAGMEIV